MSTTIYWGELLRAYRQMYHLTQSDIAGVLHTSRQNYSNIETGRTQPTPEEIAILSEIYEVDLIKYVARCMPAEYVAEQQEFKYNIVKYDERKKSPGRKTKAVRSPYKEDDFDGLMLGDYNSGYRVERTGSPIRPGGKSDPRNSDDSSATKRRRGDDPDSELTDA